MNKMNDAMYLSYESVEQISSLQRLLTENKAIKNKMEEEALHDRMTGLLNRNCFNLDIASFKFLKPNVGILYFDLNNLKEVNDKYRHEAGDQLIILLAKSIQQTSLGFPDSFAYRIGGDEFILILMNCTETMLKDAQKLFETYLSKNQTSLFCDVAIGVAFSSNMCDIEKLVSLADQNMYKVKRQMKALRMEELCH